MEQKYFMHRIQQENGTYSKGIEIHDTLDSAVLSFWGRMKLAYNNPNKPGMTFVSCKITDTNGSVLAPYNMTWLKEPDVNQFFVHHIRQDNGAYNKDIDICSNFDDARRVFAEQMEYGYNNPNHSKVTFVSCEITDLSGITLTPFDETWAKPEPEPEPEE